MPLSQLRSLCNDPYQKPANWNRDGLNRWNHSGLAFYPLYYRSLNMTCNNKIPLYVQRGDFGHQEVQWACGRTGPQGELVLCAKCDKNRGRVMQALASEYDDQFNLNGDY